MKHAEVNREAAHAELDKFLNEVVEACPSYDDGEEHVFELHAGRVAYADDDTALIGFYITTKKTRSGF